jgi:hypothetical protein
MDYTPEQLAGTVPAYSKAGKLLTPARVRQIDGLQKRNKPNRWSAGNPSPNPSGAGKGKRLLTILRERMDKTVADLFDEETIRKGNIPKTFLDKNIGVALVDAALKEALKGDFRFFKEICDRLLGPVAIKVDGMEPGSSLAVNQQQLTMLMADPDTMAAMAKLANSMTAVEALAPPARPTDGE